MIADRLWALTATQIIADKALLGWSTSTLALRAEVSLQTAEKAEQWGTAKLRPSKAFAIRNALEAAGVQFLGDDEMRVRLRSGAIPPAPTLLVERQWLAAAAERDDLRLALQAAKLSGDAAASAAARKRLKDAMHRCNSIMAVLASHRQIADLASPLPPKLAAPAPDTRRMNAAREIVSELAYLVTEADRIGLSKIARRMKAARDAAGRVIQARGTPRKEPEAPL